MFDVPLNSSVLPGTSCFEQFYTMKLHDKGCSIAHDYCCGIDFSTPYEFETPFYYQYEPVSFTIHNFSECSFEANRYEICMSNMELAWERLNDHCHNNESLIWTEACLELPEQD